MGRTSAFARVLELTRSPFGTTATEPNDDMDDGAAGGGPEAEVGPVADSTPQAGAAAVSSDLVPTPAPAAVAAVAEPAISSIEEDIASILATLEREDLAAANAADDEAVDPWRSLFDGEADEADEPVGVLLSELNRLWQADREVSAR